MLHFCIPAHNEGPTIGLVLWRLHKVFAGHAREYELLVLDDGSSDATAETLETYARLLPLTVIRHEQAAGYGSALDALARAVAKRTRYPKRDAAVFLQGDFTDPPDALPDMVKRFEGGADLVIAEAPEIPANAPKGERWVRQFAPRLLPSLRTIPGVRDPLGSLKLVRITVLRDAIKECGQAPLTEGAGWAANARFTSRLARFSRRVETVPVAPRYDLRPRASRLRAWPGALDLYRSGKTLLPAREPTT